MRTIRTMIGSGPAERPVPALHRAGSGRRMLAATAAALTLTLTAACGGGDTNGLEDVSPAEVGTRSVEALRAAESVHITGSIQDPSAEGSTAYDLVLSGKSARGTVTTGTIVTELVKVGDHTYTRGSRDYYEMIGEGDAADLLAGRWVRLGTEEAALYRFISIEGFVMMISEYVAALDGEVGTEDVAGQRAVVAHSPEGTKLWAANTGEPVPLRLEMLDGEQGRIEFADYGSDVSVTAPTDVVDLASLS